MLPRGHPEGEEGAVGAQQRGRLAVHPHPPPRIVADARDHHGTAEARHLHSEPVAGHLRDAHGALLLPPLLPLLGSVPRTLAGILLDPPLDHRPAGVVLDLQGPLQRPVLARHRLDLEGRKEDRQHPRVLPHPAPRVPVDPLPGGSRRLAPVLRQQIPDPQKAVGGDVGAVHRVRAQPAAGHVLPPSRQIDEARRRRRARRVVAAQVPQPVQGRHVGKERPVRSQHPEGMELAGPPQGLPLALHHPGHRRRRRQIELRRDPGVVAEPQQPQIQSQGPDHRGDPQRPQTLRGTAQGQRPGHRQHAEARHHDRQPPELEPPRRRGTQPDHPPQGHRQQQRKDATTGAGADELVEAQPRGHRHRQRPEQPQPPVGAVPQHRQGRQQPVHRLELERPRQPQSPRGDHRRHPAAEDHRPRQRQRQGQDAAVERGVLVEVGRAGPTPFPRVALDHRIHQPRQVPKGEGGRPLAAGIQLQGGGPLAGRQRLQDGQQIRRRQGEGERSRHRQPAQEAGTTEAPVSARLAGPTEEQPGHHHGGRQGGVGDGLRMARQRHGETAQDETRRPPRRPLRHQHHPQQHAGDEHGGHPHGVEGPRDGKSTEPEGQRGHYRPRPRRPDTPQQGVHQQQPQRHLPAGGDAEGAQGGQGEQRQVERRERRRLGVGQQRLTGPQLVRPQRRLPRQPAPADQLAEGQHLKRGVGEKRIAHLHRLGEGLVPGPDPVRNVGGDLVVRGEETRGEEGQDGQGVPGDAPPARYGPVPRSRPPGPDGGAETGTATEKDDQIDENGEHLGRRYQAEWE